MIKRNNLSLINQRQENEPKMVQKIKPISSNGQIIWFTEDKNAKIPTKKAEDAGYDIYTVENNIWLKPHKTRMFNTGIHYAINGNFWLKAADRGSTGSKGIHCHCGICDKGYRGVIFIALNNTNNYPILFTDAVEKPAIKHKWYGRKYLAYPISKGIAQLIPMPLYDFECHQVNEEEWVEKYKYNSERGSGALGSSGK